MVVLPVSYSVVQQLSDSSKLVWEYYIQFSTLISGAFRPLKDTDGI